MVGRELKLEINLNPGRVPEIARDLAAATEFKFRLWWASGVSVTFPHLS